MEEILINKILEYGMGGIMLAYFLWKDRVTFEMYKDTISKIVDKLDKMQQDIDKIKKL